MKQKLKSKRPSLIELYSSFKETERKRNISKQIDLISDIVKKGDKRTTFLAMCVLAEIAIYSEDVYVKSFAEKEYNMLEIKFTEKLQKRNQ